MYLLLTDSGVHKRVSDTLWIAFLFPLEDAAGNKLKLKLKGAKKEMGRRPNQKKESVMINSHIMCLMYVTCAFLWGVIPLTYFRTMRR